MQSQMQRYRQGKNQVYWSSNKSADKIVFCTPNNLNSEYTGMPLQPNFLFQFRRQYIRQKFQLSFQFQYYLADAFLH